MPQQGRVGVFPFSIGKLAILSYLENGPELEKSAQFGSCFLKTGTSPMRIACTQSPVLGLSSIFGRIQGLFQF